MGKHSQRRPLFGDAQPPRRRSVRIDGRGTESEGAQSPPRRTPPAADARRRSAARDLTPPTPPAGGERVRGERRPVGRKLSDPARRRRGALEAAPARLKAERERRRRRTKRLTLTILLSTLGLLLVGAVAVFGYLMWVQHAMTGTIVKDEKISAALAEAKPQEPYNVLVLGGDKRKGETKYRTDTMLMVHVDPKSKKVWMISIPRDTRVTIPGHGTGKINSAHFYGGPSLAIETVSKFTGEPIHHYLEVEFDGFKQAVDALGGVWVDVPQEIDDRKAATTSKNFRAQHIDPGYQLLDGEHALTFVRSRKFADADFTRMKHQQIFFKALADQIAKPGNLPKIPKIITKVAPYIKTDMKLMDLIRTAQSLQSAGSKNVYTATVLGEWKSPYVWPDEDVLDELVTAMREGRPFDKSEDASATVGAEATTTQSDDEKAEATKPSDVTVTVRNGAGIAGCAKQASAILKTHGFSVGDVGNANQFVYQETLVVYKSDRAAAQQVSAALMPGTKIVESRGMYGYDTEILVVVGKDWDLSKIPSAPVRTSQ